MNNEKINELIKTMQDYLESDTFIYFNINALTKEQQVEYFTIIAKHFKEYDRLEDEEETLNRIDTLQSIKPGNPLSIANTYSALDLEFKRYHIQIFCSLVGSTINKLNDAKELSKTDKFVINHFEDKDNIIIPNDKNEIKIAKFMRSKDRKKYKEEELEFLLAGNPDLLKAVANYIE